MFNEDTNDLNWIGVMFSFTYMYFLYAKHFEILKVATYKSSGLHMEIHIRSKDDNKIRITNGHVYKGKFVHGLIVLQVLLIS